MSRRGKKPPADGEVKTALSGKRKRQLESAFSLRSRSLSLKEAELRHTAHAAQTIKPANWAEKWQHIRNVTLAEAVALSLGYEPGQPDLERLTEYCKRLDLAMRCLYESHRFPGTEFSQSPIDLTKFVAWAQSIDDWGDLPDELKKLAMPTENDANPTLHEPTRPDNRGRRDDALSPAIRKAQANAEDDSVAAVFTALKCMALEGVLPFTGHVSNSGLDYTNGNNEVRPFTRNALQKRLRRENEARLATLSATNRH